MPFPCALNLLDFQTYYQNLYGRQLAYGTSEERKLSAPEETVLVPHEWTGFFRALKVRIRMLTYVLTLYFFVLLTLTETSVLFPLNL